MLWRSEHCACIQHSPCIHLCNSALTQMRGAMIKCICCCIEGEGEGSFFFTSRRQGWDANIQPELSASCMECYLSFNLHMQHGRVWIWELLGGLTLWSLRLLRLHMSAVQNLLTSKYTYLPMRKMLFLYESGKIEIGTNWRRLQVSKFQNAVKS